MNKAVWYFVTGGTEIWGDPRLATWSFPECGLVGESPRPTPSPWQGEGIW